MKKQKQEKPISDELIDGLLNQGRTAEDVNAREYPRFCVNVSRV